MQTKMRNRKIAATEAYFAKINKENEKKGRSLKWEFIFDTKKQEAKARRRIIVIYE